MFGIREVERYVNYELVIAVIISSQVNNAKGLCSLSTSALCCVFLSDCHSLYMTFLMLAKHCMPTVNLYVPLSLRIFLNLSLFSLLAVLDPRLLSQYPDHLLPHLSKLQTVFFNMRHPTFGVTSLTLSVSLIHILVFHLLTTLHELDPHCHFHFCHHQSLLLFFTLDLKHTSSSSLFHRRLLHR